MATASAGDAGSVGGPEIDGSTPIQGWVWQAKRGWFELPLDARTTEDDPSSVKVWHQTKNDWVWVVATGVELEEQSQSYTPQWNNSKNDKDGDVPGWDGKSEHRTTYFRRIELWEATTGVDMHKRGVKLLAKLTGEAFHKLENVKPEHLEFPDSVDRFKLCIINAYEPIEDYRVGKIMDQFLEDFSRKKNQEILDFNRAWEMELDQAQKVAGELTPKWQAHLYLKKIRLPSSAKSQVLTGTLGEYSVKAMMKAALTTFPNIKEAFGGRDKSDRHSGGYHAQRGNNKDPKKKGKFPFKHKGRYKKNGSRVHETNQEGDEVEESGSESSSESDSDDEEKDDEESQAPDDATENNDVPEELEEALAEAEAYVTRAKKSRAELEKARGFFKKDGPNEGKDDKMKSLKSRLPCSKCGKLGHWHKDPDCPMKTQPFKKKDPHKKHKRKKCKKRVPKMQRLRKKKKRSHRVYVETVTGVDLPYVAYADTACAKSVVGEENARAIVKFCEENSWPHAIVEDKEPFRFGPGKRIWSEKALVLSLLWGGQVVILRISIVPPEVPCLISKFVFKRLGAVLDLDSNTLLLKRLNNAIEPLYDLVTGHVGIEIVKPNVEPPKVSLEAMELCKDGEEVTVDDAKYRRLLPVFEVRHDVHVVDLPETRHISFEEQPTETSTCNPETQTDIEKGFSEDEHQSEYLTKLLTKDRSSLNPRMRAAPFFQELAPGWRARARNIVPSYKRHARAMDTTPNLIDASSEELDAGDSKDKSRSARVRVRKAKSVGRKKTVIAVDSDEDRAGGVSPEGAGLDTSPVREGNSDESSGTDQECEVCCQLPSRPLEQTTRRTGQDESRRAEDRILVKGPAGAGEKHKSPIDMLHSGRCCHTFDLDNGSCSEY